ncbi:S8 family serine peptidase [Variovorax sp. W2I14]|uniref:S8 family serine peptidase n=1 Tax=Variovorax sp. W2I14 TaxID=3042290 RepID=UPI003D1D4263
MPEPTPTPTHTVVAALTQDPYVEWALLKGLKFTICGLPSPEPKSLQLVLECDEALKDDLQAQAQGTSGPYAEYFSVAFHEIADGDHGKKIYSVSANADHVVGWREKGMLLAAHAEYSTARAVPIDEVLNWFPPVLAFEPPEAAWSSALQVNASVQPLTGNVMVIIDDGLAFLHDAFRKSDGKSTRIAYFWDQDPSHVVVQQSGGQIEEFVLGKSPGRYPTEWSPVDDFAYGRELAAAKIDTLIENLSDSRSETRMYGDLRYDRVRLALAHGTHVADLAAGRQPPRHGPAAADDAGSDATHIVMVQLPPLVSQDTSGGGLAKHVLDALTYALRKIDSTASVVVNLSFGATGGPHNGSSLFERALDSIIQRERGKGRDFALVLPAGNHFDAAGHAAGVVRPASPVQLGWQVRVEDPTESFCELWIETNRIGDVMVDLMKPDGSHGGRAQVGMTVFDGDTVESSCCAISTSTGSVPSAPAMSLILISLLPTRLEKDCSASAPHGLWSIKLSIADWKTPVAFDAWIQRDEAIPGARYNARQSLFLSTRPRQPATVDDVAEDPVKRRGTGNSISNGLHPIVAGACYATSGLPSPYTAARVSVLCNGRHQWPDLVAPGDQAEAAPGLLAAGSRSGTTIRMNGTSVAAPQVARAILNLFAGNRGGPSSKPPSPGMDSAEITDALLAGTNQGCRINSVKAPLSPLLPLDPLTQARIGAGWLNVGCDSMASMPVTANSASRLATSAREGRPQE